MTTEKKIPKTSTERALRMRNEIKAAGGAAFLVRFKTAEEMSQLQELIDSGIGDNRNEVLRKLVAERHAKLRKK